MTPHRNIGNNSVAAFAITPEDISPSPKSTVKKRFSKNRGKTAIITESSYKQELEAKLQGNKVSQNYVKKSAKRKVTFGKSSKKPVNVFKKLKKRNGDSESDRSLDDDANCLYCDELYSQSSEGWTQCITCRNWAQDGCAGIEPEDDNPEFICELCS